MKSDNGQAAPPVRAARWWVWPAILVGLLGGQMALMLAMVGVATHDRSFAVEPDYYEKALHWDAQVARDAAERSLGWAARVRLGAESGPLRERELEVRVTDAQGRPLEGAEVTLEMFHPIDAAHRVVGALTAAGPGRYVAQVGAHRAGLWDTRIAVRRGPDALDIHEQVEAPADGRGGRP